MRFTIDTPGIGMADGRFTTRGERRLMLAVLEDAMRTLLGTRHARPNAACVRQELAWFTSRDRSDPFTFERICEALVIDADWLRKRVLHAYRTAGTRALARGAASTDARSAAAR
jgi:hypothetical protein